MLFFKLIRKVVHKIYLYWESQQNAEIYGETRSDTADYRIPGISISTVKLQDARRQKSNKADRDELIEMFEKHQHKEHFP